MAKRNNFPNNNPFNLYQNIRSKHTKIEIQFERIETYTVKFFQFSCSIQRKTVHRVEERLMIIIVKENCLNVCIAMPWHWQSMFRHALFWNWNSRRKSENQWLCIINKLHSILIVKRNQFRTIWMIYFLRCYLVVLQYWLSIIAWIVLGQSKGKTFDITHRRS